MLSNDRPKVIIYNEASADGRIAVSPDRLLLYGDPRWSSINGEGYGRVFQHIMETEQPQANLEGSGSMLRDVDQPAPLPPVEGDPAPYYQDYLPTHILNRPGHRGWFGVVDSRGRMQWLYKEYAQEPWNGWYALSLVSETTPVEHLAFLRREEIPYLIAGHERVDLALALQKMKHSLGVETLLSTAGGRLNGALLRAGLVDEIHISYLPAIIGGRTTPALFSAPDLGPEEQPAHLELVSVERLDQRVWVHYRVIH